MKKILDYRPEIDGLRSVAVLSVIFYHSSILIFEKKFLPGGFIGVDIFFVISGYLITKLISTEYKKTRNFSFKNFYIRRMKRIIPALIFVIIVTFPFIYEKIPPIFLVDYLKSIISINLFISNFFFWNLGYGYDQLQNVQFQPFLHAWTLSLEEQFYLFFPIFYFFIFKRLKNYLLPLLLIGFLLSLLLSDYASYAHSAFNFYTLPTRAWEFLIGSIIFLLEPKKILINKFISSFFILIGIVCIFISIFYFNDKMYLPSLLSLVPVLGTSFILYFKYDGNFFIQILQSKILTSIGKISYSLYLWHFPVFILYPDLNFIFQITIIYFFSIISYYLVEQPFRYNFKHNFFSIKTILITNFIIILLMVYFINISKKINYEKYPAIFHQIFKKINYNINDGFNPDQNNLEKQKPNLYIAGDSHMWGLWRSLKIDERVNNSFNLINQNLGNGCYYVYEFYKIDFFTKKKFDRCTLEDQKKRRENFISKKDSIVIIGGRLPVWLYSKPNRKFFRYLEKKEDKFSKSVFENKDGLTIEDGIINSINDLLENGIKVIVIYPVPILDFYPSKKLFDLYVSDKQNFNENLKNKPFVTSYSNFMKYAKQSHELLNSINHQNLIKIYTHQLFCNEKSDACKTHDSNEIYYLDDDHLSNSGNKIIIDQIFKELKKE